MKNTRRALSLLLVLMMVLSLNLTAFAETTENATIDYYIDGDYYYSYSFDSGISVMDALKSDSDAQAVFSENPFTDKFGKPAYVLLSMMEAGSLPVNGADYGITAEAWSTINEGYGLVSVDRDAEGNITAYNYVYTGYDWTYKVFDVNGNEVDVSELYMNQYVIQPGDTVVLDYAFQEVYWTQTAAEGPWSSIYPYI